jgi:curved DNA-binding protein CbpA
MASLTVGKTGKLVGMFSKSSVTTVWNRCYYLIVPYSPIDVAVLVGNNKFKRCYCCHSVNYSKLTFDADQNNNNSNNNNNHDKSASSTIDVSNLSVLQIKSTMTTKTSSTKSLRFFTSSSSSTPNDDDDDDEGPEEEIQINVNSKCSYGIFNLPKNSSKDTVKRIFYKAAAIYHPDRPETGDAEIFRSIRHAYEKICINDNNELDSTNTIITPEPFYTRQRTTADATTFTKFADDENDTRTELQRISSELQFDIDEQTRLEIIRDYNAMLEDGAKAIRGGGWEMARYIVESDIRDQERRKRHQKKYGITTFLESGRRSNDDDDDENKERTVSLPHRRRRRT